MTIEILPPSPNGPLIHQDVREKVNETISKLNINDTTNHQQMTSATEFISVGGYQLPSGVGNAAGYTIDTTGFEVRGDGGGARYVSTGNTIAPSQTPTDLVDTRLSDPDGFEWELIEGSLVSYNGTDQWFPSPFGDQGVGTYLYSSNSWILITGAESEGDDYLQTYISPLGMRPSSTGSTVYGSVAYPIERAANIFLNGSSRSCYASMQFTDAPKDSERFTFLRFWVYGFGSGNVWLRIDAALQASGALTDYTPDMTFGFSVPVVAGQVTLFTAVVASSVGWRELWKVKGNNYLTLRVMRQAADPNDTLAGDLYLLGTSVDYTQEY